MHTIEIQRAPAVAIAAAAALLALLPLGVIVAEVQSCRAGRLLDDPMTAQRDVADLSGATVPRYLNAEELLGSAAAWDRGNAGHLRMQGSVQERIAAWKELMRLAGRQEDAGLPGYDAAEATIRAAVSREPTNAGAHLRLARLLGRKDAAGQHRELETAASLFPHNTAVRYEVAMQHLAAGNRERALQHARALAAMDDSYLLPERQRARVREQRGAGYLSLLGNSYLVRAFEIAWRASDRDRSGTVLAMAPEHQEAHDAAELFLASKGIQER